MLKPLLIKLESEEWEISFFKRYLGQHFEFINKTKNSNDSQNYNYFFIDFRTFYDENQIAVITDESLHFRMLPYL